MNSINNAAHAVGQSIVDFARTPCSLQGQKKLEQGIRNAIPYGATKENKVNAFFGSTAVKALRAPINASLNPLEIREDMSKGSKAARKIVNAFGGSHVNIHNAADKASRTAGEKAHLAVRYTLTPLRTIGMMFGVEALGGILQNAVSVAVGFIVRGIIMTAMSVIGHTLPYATLGIGAAILGRNSEKTPQEETTSLLGRIGKGILNHKGKIATGIALAAAGIIGYQYGRQAANMVTEYFTDKGITPAYDLVPDLNTSPAYNLGPNVGYSPAIDLGDYTPGTSLATNLDYSEATKPFKPAGSSAQGIATSFVNAITSIPTLIRAANVAAQLARS